MFYNYTLTSHCLLNKLSSHYHCSGYISIMEKVWCLPCELILKLEDRRAAKMETGTKDSVNKQNLRTNVYIAPLIRTGISVALADDNSELRALVPSTVMSRINTL